MLYGSDGNALPEVAPGPNEVTEKRVNAELALFDNLLHIRWVDSAYYNKAKDRYEGRYALCCWWPRVDGRWQEVQRGKWDPQTAYDIMGWFCEDIHDASTVPQLPETMMNRVRELLHKADNSRQPWAQRMASVADHNARQRKAVLDQVGDMAAQLTGELVGIKSTRHGKKTNDPERLDFRGLRKEVEQEMYHLYGGETV